MLFVHERADWWKARAWTLALALLLLALGFALGWWVRGAVALVDASERLGATALNYAHQQRLLDRDPTNIPKR